MRSTGFSLLLLLALATSGLALGQPAGPRIFESDGLVLSGKAVQGGLVIGRTEPGAIVRIDNEAVLVDDDGVFLFGIGRDHEAPRSVSVALPDRQAMTVEVPVSPREFAIERVDGLPPAQVTPPPELLERIRTDARRVGVARARRDARRDFDGGFTWPASGRISGVYGSQRVLNGEPRRPHYGVDVAAPEGAPVFAPAPGLVTLADADQYYSGGTIIVDHGHGLSSTFLHLSAVEVRVGQRVERGDPIGRVGATGRATGPHLDWRMNAGSVRIDPQLIVTGSPESGPAGH
jgi:murein DD-endopeptidase MepM/ murein hydrolase activator NlpD